MEFNYNWNWGILLQDPYFGWIWSGLYWTCAVAITAWIFAFCIGSVIGTIRTVDNTWLRMIGTTYVAIFRNIPLIVQMFLWYFIFPELVPDSMGTWIKREMPLPEFWTAVFCLATYTGARVGEQLRAGISAIPAGQRNAAMAMGLTQVQTYRYILLPVSFRLIVPPLTSDFLGVFKNSSVALTIGVVELTAQSRQIEEYTFQGFEAFTVATVLYILITAIVMVIMQVVEKRTAIPGMITLGAK
jgi:glutamate/aspartate transport system permease protein